MSEKIEVSVQEKKSEKQQNTLVYDWIDLCFHLVCISNISFEQTAFSRGVNSLTQLPISMVRLGYSASKLRLSNLLKSAKINSSEKLEHLKESSLPETQLSFAQFYARLEYNEAQLHTVAVSQHPVLDGRPNDIPFSFDLFCKGIKISTDQADPSDEGLYSILLVKYEECIRQYSFFIGRMETIYSHMREKSEGKESSFFPDNIIIDMSGDEMIRAYMKSLYNCIIKFRELCIVENIRYLQVLLQEGVVTNSLHIQEHRNKQINLQSYPSPLSSGWYNH